MSTEFIADFCCDHCGEPHEGKRMAHYDKLPYDTADKDKGFAGSVCFLCDRELKQSI